MKKLTALGAYIFQGGFTLGVRKHFDVLAHFEDGPFGVATAQHNIRRRRQPLPVYQNPKTWPVEQFSRKVHYLYGNPPCSPWSNAGSRIGRPHWSRDPLSSCWRRTAELAWQLLPDVVAIESVRPIYTKGREMIEGIAREGRRLGYQPVCILENAIDCNLPQKRPRFVLVLTRYEYQASPTHGIDVTPSEVLAKLHNMPENNMRAANAVKGSVEYEVLKRAKPGERLSKLYMMMYPRRKQVNGKYPGRPGHLRRRLHPDQWSPAQTGSSIIYHHRENRYLTIGEAAALCGYPHDFEFIGSISSCYQQMGKAVMPPVGEHLAKDAKRTILKAVKPARGLPALEITIGRETVITKEIEL